MVLEKLFESSQNQSVFVNTFQSEVNRLDIFKNMESDGELSEDSDDHTDLLKALQANKGMTKLGSLPDWSVVFQNADKSTCDEGSSLLNTT